MTVYLDSTFVIRQLLGTGGGWKLWGKWDAAYSSVLTRTECLRAANLLRLEGKLSDDQRARLGSWIETVASGISQVAITDEVLNRAAEAFPVPLGTLQGIHLATLLELRAVRGVTCALATDDPQLLRAAESLGFADAFKQPAEPAPVAAPAAPAPAPVPPAPAPAAPAAEAPKPPEK